jgi:hypothetical protein
MTSWLEMPELEALVQAADAKPCDLVLLCECVEAIAIALQRSARLEGRPPVVTFWNPKGAYYNVRVHENRYSIAYQRDVGQLKFTLDRTEELAWKICGYKCTPAAMRAARARADREGFTSRILPERFFHTDNADDRAADKAEKRAQG